MVRFRTPLLASLLLVLGAAAGWWLQDTLPAPAHAQSPVYEEEPNEAERARLYDALHQDVAALEAQGNVLKKVVKLVKPTVIHIEAKKRSTSTRRPGRVESVDEAGSGVCIQYNGKFYVLTNRHVIKDAALEDITLHIYDGRELHPKQVLADSDTDVAVLPIEATNLFAARLGDSDTVEIGDFVLAVGSPFGLSHSVTYGIISAKGRRDLKLGDDSVRFQDFMQTDAAINPGNSGGPLLNLRGEVIGINTAIASNSGGNEGIGFTIPINMVMIIGRQLVEHGSVSRAFLGVNLDSKFGPATATRLGLPRVVGAHVTGVTANSPAALAQLRTDDVILEFRGVRIQDDNHLVNLVSLTETEQEVPVVVFREGRTVTVNVKVGDRRKFEQRRSEAAPPAIGGRLPSGLGHNEVEVWDIEELGLSLVSVDPKTARKLQISTNARGMVVIDIVPDGPSAGLVDKGEIIDSIDQRPVRNIADLDEVLAQSEPGKSLRVRLSPSDGSPVRGRTVAIRPAAPSTAR